MKTRRLYEQATAGFAALCLLCAAGGPALAQEDAAKGIERYREMMADPFANPGLLYVDQGEVLWKEKAGEKNVSLAEVCDLGKGVGVVAGAFAELPRYFADADKVMDVESRILWCMEKLQGRDVTNVKKKAFSGAGEGGSEMEKLATYVGNASNGMKFALKLEHPKEKQSYAIGEKLFYMKAGPHDFSCQTCHSEDGTRIRLQDLANLTNAAGAIPAVTTWPAYRVSTDSVKTMQHRMSDCYRQMRMPKVGFGSDAVTALITFLVKTSEGGEVNIPALKR
ncbi:MAG: sulfur oxidation c-type cytochrome SoxA [Hyphomicrobiaceae bacterium]|nr:sulfur oxidation c-type cytochrome SoxA [Hyphomicrobiaceae bacterium]